MKNGRERRDGDGGWGAAAGRAVRSCESSQDPSARSIKRIARLTSLSGTAGRGNCYSDKWIFVIKIAVCSALLARFRALVEKCSLRAVKSYIRAYRSDSPPGEFASLFSPAARPSLPPPAAAVATAATPAPPIAEGGGSRGREGIGEDGSSWIFFFNVNHR